MRFLSPAEASSGDRGFTLLELLITLAVLGIAIIPMMMVYVDTWRAVTEAKRRNQGAMLARQQVSFLKGTTAYSNLTGTYSNQFSDPYQAFNYTIQVQDIGGGANSSYKAKILQSRVTFVSRYGPERSVSCPDLNECNLGNSWDYTQIITPMQK